MNTNFKYIKNCKECGKEFQAKQKNAIFCCVLCKNRHRNKKTHVCVECGRTFTNDDHSGRHKYCSEECAKKHKNRETREWYANNTEHVAEYRKVNRPKITRQHREYCKKNPERVKQLTYASHDRARERKRRDKLAAKQEELFYTADLTPIAEKFRHTWEESLHITRLTVSTFMCNDCGQEFVLTKNPSGVSTILNARVKSKAGNPCPYCGKSPVSLHRMNTAEAELQEIYPNFTLRCYRPEWMEGLELDLFDPEAKVAIEFHGLIWHSTYKKSDAHAAALHERKADLCERNGVQLLQIFETEWVSRRQCVLDKIDAIFHRDMTRVFARKLELRELNDAAGRTLVNDFMDRNHIQGHASCQWAVGLFCEGEPMAVCTFKYGTAYAAGGQTDGTEKYWELNRYATRLHFSVVGGITRCVKAFMRTHVDVDRIVSFADRRWTCPSRSAYSSSGFVETGRSPSNYVYTDLNPLHPVHNKQFMRKSQILRRAEADPLSKEAKIYSPDLTETEMSRRLGFFRLYDAGKIRYEYRP